MSKAWKGPGRIMFYKASIIGSNILLIAVAFISGCTDSYSYQTPFALHQKLEQIDTIESEILSISEPVTVEQAKAKHTEKLKDPNEPARQVEMTLEQVRIATLENNLGLKVDLLSPAIAQTFVDEEQAKFESVFYGSSSFQRDESSDNSSVIRTTRYNAGLLKPLITGGSVRLDLPFSNTEATGSDRVSQLQIGVSYAQPLLRGAGTSINTQSIRIAQMQRNIVDAGTKLKMINLLAKADAAYWQLFSARKQLDVRREQYKLAQDQLEHARKKVASGAAARIEIVRAEAGVASRIEAVINAENLVESRYRDLRQIMNRPDLSLGDEASIVPKTMPNPLGLEIDHQRLIKYALDNRMDLIQLDIRLSIDELDIELAQNSTLPDLSITGRYQATGLASSVSDSCGNLFKSPSESFYLGLSLNLPLGNQASKAQLRRARLYKLAHQGQKDELQQIIRKQVHEAASDIETNWRRILAAEQGVEAAYRDYQVEQSQFQLGIRTSTDVLQAATRLADAQLARIYAFADYEIAQIGLARATGTLLGHAGIVITPIGNNM